MFEDDVFEAFEFLNSGGKHNLLRVAKNHDITEELGVSNSTPRFRDRFNDVNQKQEPADKMKDLNFPFEVYKEENLTKYGKVNSEMYEAEVKNVPICTIQSEHKMTENPRRKQKYEIEIHKGKYSAENIKEQNSSTYENVLASNSSVTGKGRFNDRVSSTISGVTINSPLIQELEKKGVLINSAETTVARKYLKEEACAYTDIETILEDAMKDFNAGNQYLFYGRSNVKREDERATFQQKAISERDFMRRPSDHRKIYKKQHIKTLGDSLEYFGLLPHLQKLETSLEDVRRNTKNREDQEESFKQVDKEIQKLSFKYHPDKVKNRGGTEKELKSAQRLQTALNATRTALKLLNSAFIEDIGTDHKFGFYTKLNIDSLCNEDEIKYRIYEVIFKIGVISRIRQQNIISEIRKFLIESKACVDSYLGGATDFAKHRDLALFHLKCCIKGFKKLHLELEVVKEQCKSEKNGESMHSLIQNMASDSKRDLRVLKSLKKTAKASLKGEYQFFSPDETMDQYFVLPLVAYTNVILMCNVMVRNRSIMDIFNFHSKVDPRYTDDLGYLMHSFYLASYYSGNKYHEEMMLKIMDKIKLIRQGLKIQISKEEIELEFYKCMEQVKEFMEYKFKVEDYYEAPTTNLLMVDLKKCMTLMTEFQEKEQELSKGIEEFQKKTEKMDEKYEKFDKMMEATEELNQMFKERLEQSKKMSEKISNALSDQL